MAAWASPEVISAALTGDEAAAERLITAVWPACFRLAAALLGDPNLAQDAAQEACVIVHRKIRTLRSPIAFNAWLYRIVIRESNRVRPRSLSNAQPFHDKEFTNDGAMSLDVWRALGHLSSELREVTVLFYFDDLKSSEIATVLGIPHPTVRTRLGRARDCLRQILVGYGDGISSEREEAEENVF